MALTRKLLICISLLLPGWALSQHALLTVHGKTDGDSITIMELRRAKGILVRAIDSRDIYRVKSYTVKAKRNGSQRGYKEPVFKQEHALFDHELMNFIANQLQAGDFLYFSEVKAVDSSGIEAIAAGIKLVVKAEPLKRPRFSAIRHLAAPDGIRNERLAELLNVRSGLVSLEELKNSAHLVLRNEQLERTQLKIEHFELTIKRGVGKSNINFSSDSSGFSPKLVSFIHNHLENGDELRFDNIRVAVDSVSYIVPGTRMIVDAPFYADRETRNFISIRGRIVEDNASRQGMSNLSVTVLVDDTDHRYRTRSNEQGGFAIDELLQGSDYHFIVEATEEVPEGTEVTLLNEHGFAIKQLTVGERTSVSDEEMDGMDEGYALDKIDLDSLLVNKEAQMEFSLHLNFSARDDELLRTSKEQVVKIINFLKMNPDYSVDFVVYTDARGNDMLSILVTEQRAYRITNFMLKHGIPYHRISYSGGGEGKIVNHCSNGVDCTEKEHQVNRRIEFMLYKS